MTTAAKTTAADTILAIDLGKYKWPPASPTRQAPGEPRTYRLGLPVRKPDEKEITRDTRPVSADVFLDRKSDRLFYVGEGGKVLALPWGKSEAVPNAKGAKWLHRLVLPVRKWDEKDFGKDSSK